MNATLDELRRDHQRVLDELAEFERRALQGGDADDRFAAFSEFLAGEISQHFTVEEEALFPLLGRHLGTEVGPIAVMLSEHAQFRRLQEGLAHAVKSGDRTRQQAGARAIVELLRAHIGKEDNVLFPMAERLLAPDEQEEVDRRAQVP
jgi:regulator of cell morphogenesis and NO signaling